MIQNPSNTTETSPGSYQFTGAELAAIRLVELIGNQPIVKDVLERASKNHSVMTELVNTAAKFIDDPAKQQEFRQSFSDTEKKPVEDLKSELIEFIAKNFEAHQIEYMIGLATDLRLPDLVKRVVTIAEDFGKELFAGSNDFARAVNQALNRPINKL